MQVINGKEYNNIEIGGFLLLVPVFGKHAEYVLNGDLKEVALKLKELDERAHEENKKRYQKAREKYATTYTRIEEIKSQLSSDLLKRSDIEALEAIRLLSEEKNKLEFDLYDLSKTVDQLYDKEFIPERKPEPQSQTELTPLSSNNDDYTQTTGDKVRELRLKLGESQAQFGSHFNVHQTQVSAWETNKLQPPKEVLEYQPPENVFTAA